MFHVEEYEYGHVKFQVLNVSLNVRKMFVVLRKKTTRKWMREQRVCMIEHIETMLAMCHDTDRETS